MADEIILPENYQETNVTGTKYKRAYQVQINNPKDGTPNLYIMEQDVINLDGEVIYRNCGSLYTTLDPTNELHNEIYNKLNELYILLRNERDDK